MSKKVKRFISVVLALSLAVVLCVPISAYTSGTSNLSNGFYSIKALCNNKYLDIANADSSYAKIQIWDYNLNQRNQTFYLEKDGSYWAIFYGVTNKAVSVENSSLDDRANLILTDYTGKANQQWSISKNSDNSYCIINRNSGKYIDVYNGDSQNGTRLIQFYSHGGINQKFEFVDVTKEVNQNSNSYSNSNNGWYIDDNGDEIEMVIGDDDEFESNTFYYKNYVVYNYTEYDLDFIPKSDTTYLAKVNCLYANTVLDYICDQLVPDSLYKTFVKAARSGKSNGSVNPLIEKTYVTFSVEYNYDKVYIRSTESTKYLKWTKNNRIKAENEADDWTIFEYV